MPLLFDSDAFCKLALCDLLERTARLVGVNLVDCRRLPALPHMLQRGRLYRKLGEPNCSKLHPIAVSIPAIPPPSGPWLDRLAGVPAIDPGEAQLFAGAIEQDALLVSGDKRALIAACGVPDLGEALRGRVLCLESVLLELCRHEGADAVRAIVAPLKSLDTVVGICFSEGNERPEDGLLSYISDLQGRLGDSAILWTPASAPGG